MIRAKQSLRGDREQRRRLCCRRSGSPRTRRAKLPIRRDRGCKKALKQEGLRLVYLSRDEDMVRVGVENNTFGQAAQALGRTARVLANEQPPQSEHFDIALMSNGVPLSAVRVNRNDLYELEHDPDNAWRSFARARISDTIPVLQGGYLSDAYPHFSYRFGPYLNFSFFDPDDPLRYEIGAALGLDYTLSPGLTLSTGLRQPILSTLDDSTPGVGFAAAACAVRLGDLCAGIQPAYRASDGRIHVAAGGKPVWPAPRWVTWKPCSAGSRPSCSGIRRTAVSRLGSRSITSPSAIFDVLFGFQDYSVATGHVSAYYDLPGDYHAQIDAGRYLAGDYGATFSLDREFNNGFTVGAFFTPDRCQL